MKGFKSLLFLFALLFYACATTKETVTNLTFPTIISKIESRYEKIQSLSADGNLTVESPDFNGSTNFKINYRKPDTLSLQLKAIFGLSVGYAEINGDDFKLRDDFNDRTIYGKVGEYVKRFLGLSLNTVDFIRFMLASPKLNFDEYVENDGIFYLTTKVDADVDAEFEIDAGGEVKSCVFRKNGEKILRVDYRRYSDFGGISLPRTVRIFDYSGRALILNFSEIKIELSQ